MLTPYSQDGSEQLHQAEALAHPEPSDQAGERWLQPPVPMRCVRACVCVCVCVCVLRVYVCMQPPVPVWCVRVCVCV